ncbi:unnamed protein product [Miscanthus lutarioriparius]|uniref:Thioredoxin domain-containing protein n=1 Tax=Miscanthus lutarioriparius TaxID=422564 RepID=A0A811NJR1_9POAL|nr:unnamed protein product [Miscanthus lutarioriparius]
MSLSVAGARTTSLLPSAFAASSSRPRLIALPLLHRRSHGALASPPAAGRRLRRLRVRMARAESTGVGIGFRAPEFELPEPLTGKLWTLDDFEGNSALLVMFICNHCPFVKHLKKDIAKLTSFYVEKGLGAVAISSNSVRTHPQDGPERMAEEAKLFKYHFPYLYDESQEVAKAFGAVCTPEFYLFKKWPRIALCTKAEVTLATSEFDSLLSHLTISFLLSDICVWFPVVSAATSNGTHEVLVYLVVSGCGEKYRDVSLLAFDSVQVHRALNFKSVLTAFGNRVVREKPGNFSCVTGATV